MKFILPRVGLLLAVGLLSLLSCKKSNVSEYSLVIVETLKTSKNKVVAPVTNANDGSFAFNRNNKYIYWCFEGKWRHIISNANYTLLFSKGSYIDYAIPFSSVKKIGADLGDNCDLRILPSGAIYFLEGNLVRCISSWDVFNKYHFNSTTLKSPFTKVDNIMQYQLGAPIY